MKGVSLLSRHNTEAWNAIHSMCRLQELDEENLYQKSKLLLNIYRRVCWTTIGRADYVAEELCLYCGSDLDEHCFIWKSLLLT